MNDTRTKEYRYRSIGIDIDNILWNLEFKKSNSVARLATTRVETWVWDWFVSYVTIPKNTDRVVSELTLLRNLEFKIELYLVKQIPENTEYLSWKL